MMLSVSPLSMQPRQQFSVQKHRELKKGSPQLELESKQADSNPSLTDSHLRSNIVNRCRYTHIIPRGFDDKKAEIFREGKKAELEMEVDQFLEGYFSKNKGELSQLSQGEIDDIQAEINTSFRKEIVHSLDSSIKDSLGRKPEFEPEERGIRVGLLLNINLYFQEKFTQLLAAH